MNQKVVQEWKNRVQAEYTSAAITAQVLQWMIVMAMPDSLINTAMRIVRDELDHARLSHDCYIEFGGDNAPPEIHANHLVFDSAKEGVYASFVKILIRSFCLGETFAVPLFHRMYEGVSHPTAQKVLTRVLRDEAVHRAFGWDALDELLSRDAQNLIPFIENILPQLVQGFQAAYANEHYDIAVNKQERQVGLMSAQDYREVWTETYQNDVMQRFAKRNIKAPDLRALS